MPKGTLKQFISRNKFGAILGAAVSSIVYLLNASFTGQFFALQRLFPNVDPKIVTGGEGLAWALVVGALAGMLINEIVPFEKILQWKN